MLYTEKIEELIRLGIAWGVFIDEPPVNLMLVCPPESGKTELIKQFRKIKGVHYTADLVYRSLTEFLLKEIVDGKIKTLLIPDFIKIISKNRSTVANIETILLQLIEEGIENVDAGTCVRLEKPASCNLITGITEKSFNAHKIHWQNIGFFSRFIIVSYRYSPKQLNNIFEFIRRQQYIEKKIISMEVKPENITLNEKYSFQLETFIRRYSETQKLYGFRFMQRIQTLLKTSALLENRKEVTQKDVDKLAEILKYANTCMYELD